MRTNYYRFPEEATTETILEGYGMLDDWYTEGHSGYENIKNDPNGHRVIGQINVTTVKELIRRFGGTGWTNHWERDGGLFEVTPITFNSRTPRKYNHHL